MGSSIQQLTTPFTNTLQVFLETGTTYHLYMNQLGVRTGKQVVFAQSEAPPTGYLTAVSDRTPVLVEQTAIKLTVEVRETFSNPQSGVKVEARIVDGGGSLDRIEDISNGKGQVSFQYTAPEIARDTSGVSEETVTVLVKITDTTGGQYAVSFEVQVQNTHNGTPASSLHFWESFDQTREFDRIGQTANRHTATSCSTARDRRGPQCLRPTRVGQKPGSARREDDSERWSSPARYRVNQWSRSELWTMPR